MFLGTTGTPGGIAVRISPSSIRYAYVSDTTAHCIHAFNIDSRSHSVVAGLCSYPETTAAVSFL